MSAGLSFAMGAAGAGHFVDTFTHWVVAGNPWLCAVFGIVLLGVTVNALLVKLFRRFLASSFIPTMLIFVVFFVLPWLVPSGVWFIICAARALAARRALLRRLARALI